MLVALYEGSPVMHRHIAALILDEWTVPSLSVGNALSIHWITEKNPPQILDARGISAYGLPSNDTFECTGTSDG